MSKKTTVFVGILLTLIGLQLRTVESFVLRPETTRMLAHIAESDSATGTAHKYIADNVPIKKVLTPPPFVGWALISAGVVVVVFALRKLK